MVQLEEELKNFKEKFNIVNNEFGCVRCTYKYRPQPHKDPCKHCLEVIWGKHIIPEICKNVENTLKL
jgi:hypothetical protein